MPMDANSSDSAVDFARRGFMTLQRSRAPVLPWASLDSITANCTGCGDCIAACPERIIVQTAAGVPTVTFESTGCTFCGACADACTHGVFSPDRHEAWSLQAAVSDRCMEIAGVSCRLCDDACDELAIRFRPQSGGRTSVEIDAQSCTGCGTCISRCPVGALSVAPAERGGPSGVR
jgi:ferredoxin-type protein NapF